jgi:hypothetical protein
LEVTVNHTGLLSFMLGATDTTSIPVVAFEGTVAVTDMSLQELIVIGTAFNVTILPPCEAPKFEPLITTCVPTFPVVADTPVMTGAVFVVELTDMFSKFALTSEDVPLFTARPI